MGRLPGGVLVALGCMRHALALALALSTACTDIVGVTVYDETMQERTAELPPEVQAACDILMIPCVASDDGPLVLSMLDLTDMPGTTRGRTMHRKGCQRSAWAHRDPQVIAHEIAHMLGLNHNRNPDNLMAPVSRGTYLSHEQLQQLTDAAVRLSGCQ